MDLYRALPSGSVDIDSAENYYRQYKNEYIIKPESRNFFTLHQALLSLTEVLRFYDLPQIAFILRCKLTCELSQKLMQNLEIRPTSVIFTKTTVDGTEVLKEIQV